MKIKKIGWLRPNDDFIKGETSEVLLEKLILILKREQVNLLRRIHACTLCGNVQYLYPDNKIDRILGICMIWIPDKNNEEIIYSAEDLIIHYIRDHKYLPPKEFIESALAFDLNSSWSGQKIFNTLTGMSEYKDE